MLPQLARAHGEGHTLSVGYFLPWKDALVEELRQAGCEVECFGARSAAGMLARVPRVATWLEARRADVVHAHLPLAGVVARLAARRIGRPVIYTEHNLQERYHWLTRRANLWTWGLQRCVVAVSDEVAQSIARHAPSGVPVHVVHNGIESLAMGTTAGREVRRTLGIQPEEPVVGTVAVFRRQKRLDLWLETARRVAERVPEARFLLVGDGPLRRRVEGLAKAWAKEGQVHLVGLQEEVAPYLSAMDVYLMTSEHEGLPLALLEAMAAGRAAVVTAVGGIPEVVRDGETGVLLPLGDLDGLSDATVRLLQDSQRRAQLGEAARADVEARFGIQRMASDLESLYRELAGER